MTYINKKNLLSKKKLVVNRHPSFPRQHTKTELKPELPLDIIVSNVAKRENDEDIINLEDAVNYLSEKDCAEQNECNVTLINKLQKYSQKSKCEYPFQHDISDWVRMKPQISISYSQKKRPFYEGEHSSVVLNQSLNYSTTNEPQKSSNSPCLARNSTKPTRFVHKRRCYQDRTDCPRMEPCVPISFSQMKLSSCEREQSFMSLNYKTMNKQQKSPDFQFFAHNATIPENVELIQGDLIENQVFPNNHANPLNFSFLEHKRFITEGKCFPKENNELSFQLIRTTLPENVIENLEFNQQDFTFYVESSHLNRFIPKRKYYSKNDFFATENSTNYVFQNNFSQTQKRSNFSFCQKNKEEYLYR